MKLLDYLPHRLLANYALKKEAERVNDRYEEVIKEIESKRRQNEEEIKKAREIANANIQEAVCSLNDQLNQYADTLADQGADICEYARLYFERNYLRTKLNCIVAERKIAQEYISFLTSQMTIVGNEIATLEERKAILAQKADVSDIIRLIRLSGAVISIDDTESAETLLSKVYSMTVAYKDDLILRSTLRRLERLVQEREELLSLIQYIDWIIEQKKRLSKEWKDLRSNLRKQVDEIDERLKKCQEEQGVVEDQIDSQAQKIRSVWAKPLLSLSADLTEKKSEKARLISEVREHNEEIQQMKEAHSSDSDRWDRLHREKDDLKEQLRGTDQEIKRIEVQRRELKDKASSIYDLCRRIGTPLIGDGKGQNSDEYTLLIQRISELSAIEDEGKREAENEFTSAKQQLINEKGTTLSAMQDKIEETQTRYEALKNLVRQKASHLDKMKERDKKARSFFVRLFKKNPEIEQAESELRRLRNQLNEEYDSLQRLLKLKGDQSAEYDHRIATLRKVYKRPTYSERKEMERLKRYRERLIQIYEARRKKP